jgi:hypothetical protein
MPITYADTVLSGFNDQYYMGDTKREMLDSYSSCPKFRYAMCVPLTLVTLTLLPDHYISNFPYETTYQSQFNELDHQDKIRTENQTMVS